MSCRCDGWEVGCQVVVVLVIERERESMVFDEIDSILTDQMICLGIDR